MIQVRGLRAGYRERQVLGPLSFDLRRGETSALLGPGGAGKSTLLRILSGAPGSDLWSQGSVMPPATESPRYLPQKAQELFGTFGEQLSAASGGREFEAAISAVWSSIPEAVGVVQSLVDTPLASIDRDRARLARLTLALAGAPAFVLLDEPDADLDEPWLSFVRRLLFDWRSRTTLVLATHHLEIAREVSDRIFLLIGGKLLESGRTAKIFDQPAHPRTREFLRMGS